VSLYHHHPVYPGEGGPRPDANQLKRARKYVGRVQAEWIAQAEKALRG
jgi:hypothetical protein